MLVRLPRGRLPTNGVPVLAAVTGLVCTATVLWAGPLVALIPALVGLAALGLGSSFWAVTLFVLSLPLGLVEGLVPTGPVDLVQLLAAVVVGLVVLQRLPAGRSPLGWHPAAGWAVTFVVLVVVSTVTAWDVAAAIPLVAALVVAVALALAVVAACPRWVDLRHLTLALALVGTGACLYSLGSAGDIQASLPGAGAVDNRAAGIFQSPNQLGTFSGMLIFVGLGLALGARNKVERLAGMACVVSATAALGVSLSRGAWIGAAFAVVVFVVLSPRARRALPAALVVGGTVSAVVISLAAPELWRLLVGRAGALLSVGANPDDARPMIYQEAARQIGEHPWTGQGPGNFPLVLESADSVAPAVNVLHAHNVLLHVGAEAGIPAAAVLVMFTLAVARSVLRARKHLPDREADLLVGLAAGLAMMVGQGLVDFTLGNPTLLFLVWTIVGMVFTATTRRPAPDVRTADPTVAVGRPGGSSVADPALA